MTLREPASVTKEKIEETEENLDKELKRYLTKWIVAFIFYEVSWIVNLTRVILPSSFIKIALGFYIIHPKSEGHYPLYRLLESSIH